MGDSKGVAAMEIESVPEALEWHARHCERADAPITARVIRSLLAIMQTDTASGRRLVNWAGKGIEDALALRAVAGLHSLHLSGEEPRLEPVFAGLIANQGQIDAIASEAAQSFDHRLLPWFDGPPQTNEAGRSASVMGALMWLSGKLGPRFELNEIGASAGINSMMARFHFDLGGVTTGPSLSSIKLKPEWRGNPPPANPVEIVAARGCDISPIDLTDPAQANRLKAYIWADARDRMARMDAAIAMAGRMPPDLVKQDAGAFVKECLAAEQAAGITRVLFHTIMWQYLPAGTRTDIKSMMEQAGAAASADKPLAWISLETNRETFRHECRVRYWPDGEGIVQLAEAHPHGAWVEWMGD